MPDIDDDIDPLSFLVYIFPSSVYIVRDIDPCMNFSVTYFIVPSVTCKC